MLCVTRKIYITSLLIFWTCPVGLPRSSTLPISVYKTFVDKSQCVRKQGMALAVWTNITCKICNHTTQELTFGLLSHISEYGSGSKFVFVFTTNVSLLFSENEYKQYIFFVAVPCSQFVPVIHRLPDQLHPNCPLETRRIPTLRHSFSGNVNHDLQRGFLWTRYRNERSGR